MTYNGQHAIYFVCRTWTHLELHIYICICRGRQVCRQKMLPGICAPSFPSGHRCGAPITFANCHVDVHVCIGENMTAETRVDMRLLVPPWSPVLCCIYAGQYNVFEYDINTSYWNGASICPHNTYCVEIPAAVLKRQHILSLVMTAK